MPLVMGYKRVPLPPANTIPFIFEFLIKNLQYHNFQNKHSFKLFLRDILNLVDYKNKRFTTVVPLCAMSPLEWGNAISELTPNHLINDTDVRLHYFHNLCRYIFINIIRYWDSMLTISTKFNGCIYCLKQ